MLKVKIRLRVSARECIVHRGDFGLRAASVKCQQESECALVGLVLHPGKAIEIDEALDEARRATGDRRKRREKPGLGLADRLVQGGARRIDRGSRRSAYSVDPRRNR